MVFHHSPVKWSTNWGWELDITRHPRAVSNLSESQSSPVTCRPAPHLSWETTWSCHHFWSLRTSLAPSCLAPSAQRNWTKASWVWSSCFWTPRIIEGNLRSLSNYLWENNNSSPRSQFRGLNRTLVTSPTIWWQKKAKESYQDTVYQSNWYHHLPNSRFSAP